MNTTRKWMALLLVWSTAGALSAEEIELFNAQTAPEEAWSWSDARIRKQDNRLVVTEINKQGMVGNVFPENRFPYHPGGVVALDVESVPSGSYTFQVMAFAGATPIFTVEPVKDSTQAGPFEIPLAKLNLPPETQSILFKLWVGNAEGASAVLKNLRYTVPVAPDVVLLDERFASPTDWTASDCVLASATQGVRMSLSEGKSFGNILLNQTLGWDDNAWLLVHAPEVSAGTITLQLAAFNGMGEYLESVDAIHAVGAGWHGIRLGQVAWPQGTLKFQVKLWLGGASESSAVFDRLLLMNDNRPSK